MADFEYAEDAPMSSGGDDYDWNSWDQQANEYLTSSDYSGPSFSTGDGQQWGGMSQQGGFDMSNISNSPMEGWQQNGTDWGGVDQQLGTQFNNPMTDLMGVGQQLPSMGGISNTLSGIFNNKGAMTGLSAILEGMQNKKKQQAQMQLAQRMQPAMDPFGSQRAFYQQQLQSAVQDPYSSPIVRDQVAQLTNAQRIADAKAGRRSNQATSNPALLAAQAEIAQKYMNSLQQPAGAGIGPQGLSSILQTQQQGINAGVNGFASPLMSAVGYNSGSNNNQAQLDAIRKLLTGGQ